MEVGLKVLSVVTGLGLVGGAGVATSYLLSDNSIGKALKDKGHTLLDFDISKTNDKKTWEPIVTAYAKSNKKLNNLIITITPTDGTPSQTNVDDLKKACSKTIQSNNNEEVLKVAEQFCVTPITIKNFSSKQRTSLDTNNNDQGNVSEWNKKVENYSKEGNKNLMENVNVKTGNEETKRNQLRTACTKLEEKKTYEADFHSNLAKYEEWCSIPKKE